VSIASDFAFETGSFKLPRRTFGAGGSEPYARALRDTDSTPLYLHELHDDSPSKVGAAVDVARFNAAADDVDLRLLASVRGPVLDVGCGPGRMVRAAMELGLDALGIDVSSTAVEIAREHGLAVLQVSVFDALPLEGHWQSVLLVDGNIGIGGDVEGLLARCAQLMSYDGDIVIEVHPDAYRERTFTGRLSDGDGGHSETFPWAEIGLQPLIARAAVLGLRPRQSWSEDGRTFCRLAYIRR
jgi:SAM-dependent methyltransferase